MGKRQTYNLLEDVDLVEKHALLILVHVALPEHLDGSLRVGLSVDAHADLAERARSEDLTDPVVVSELAVGLANEVRLPHSGSALRIFGHHLLAASLKL